MPGKEYVPFTFRPRPILSVRYNEITEEQMSVVPVFCNMGVFFTDVVLEGSL